MGKKQDDDLIKTQPPPPNHLSHLLTQICASDGREVSPDQQDECLFYKQCLEPLISHFTVISENRVLERAEARHVSSQLCNPRHCSTNKEQILIWKCKCFQTQFLTDPNSLANTFHWCSLLWCGCSGFALLIWPCCTRF